jgi:hypothetical protein
MPPERSLPYHSRLIHLLRRPGLPKLTHYEAAHSALEQNTLANVHRPLQLDIKRRRVQNGSTEHVIQNAIRCHATGGATSALTE